MRLLRLFHAHFMWSRPERRVLALLPGVLLVVAATVVLPATAQPLFVGLPNVDISSATVPLSIGDVNGDGVPDLVAFGSACVSVFPGTGGGWFGSAHDVPFYDSFRTGTLADVNGDGSLDIVAAGRFASAVHVFANDGAGNFGPAAAIADGGSPAFVLAGDFDGDSLLDLVVANLDSASVSALPGHGDGTFGTPVRSAVGARPGTLAVGDFDSDGNLDLAAASAFPTSLVILHGDGHAHFTPAASMPLADGALFVVAADLDEDGAQDLLAPSRSVSGVGSLSVRMGHGDGAFAPAVEYAAGEHNRGFGIGDFDENGTLDAAFVENGAVHLLAGRADGTFGAEGGVPGGSPTSLPQSLRSSTFGHDLDGDGHLDLLVPLQFSFGTSATSLLGHGDGTFVTIPTLATGPDPSSLAIADLDGDGWRDIVVTDGSGYFAVLPGTGGGTFGPPEDHASLYGVGGAVIADLDADARADLLLVQNAYSTDVSDCPSFSGGVLAMRGAGGRAFGPTLPFGSFYANTHCPGWLSARVSAQEGDLDGDAIPDVVLVETRYASSIFYGGSGDYGVWVLHGNGDGTFAPPDSSDLLPNTPQAQPLIPALGDCNVDGKLDLVLLDCAADSVSVRLGTGGGTFQPPVTFHDGTGDLQLYGNESTPWLKLADLDGDGSDDIVLGQGSPNALSGAAVFLGNADGTYRAAPRLAVDHPRTVAIGELDGDGIPDVATAEFALGTIDVRLGQGDGTFGPRQKIAGLGRAMAVAISDVNRDARPDLVTLNGWDGSVSMYLNTLPSLADAGGPRTPARFRLLAPRPNPARGSLQVRFETPRAGPARAEVFDVAGRQVRRLLASDRLPAGLQVVSWDGRTDAGAREGAGVYFVRVTTPSGSGSVRVVYLGN